MTIEAPDTSGETGGKPQRTRKLRRTLLAIVTATVLSLLATSAPADAANGQWGGHGLCQSVYMTWGSSYGQIVTTATSNNSYCSSNSYGRANNTNQVDIDWGMPVYANAPDIGGSFSVHELRLCDTNGSCGWVLNETVNY